MTSRISVNLSKVFFRLANEVRKAEKIRCHDTYTKLHVLISSLSKNKMYRTRCIELLELLDQKFRGETIEPDRKQK